MPAYADSSLLLKLYVREMGIPAALAQVSNVSGPFLFSALHRLELCNAIRRNLATKRIHKGQALAAFRALRRDLHSGFYVRVIIDWESTFRRAHRLSQNHASRLAVRALDMLHISTALEFGASAFLSFDDRQWAAADAEGI